MSATKFRVKCLQSFNVHLSSFPNNICVWNRIFQPVDSSSDSLPPRRFKRLLSLFLSLLGLLFQISISTYMSEYSILCYHLPLVRPLHFLSMTVLSGESPLSVCPIDFLFLFNIVCIKAPSSSNVSITSSLALCSVQLIFSILFYVKAFAFTMVHVYALYSTTHHNHGLQNSFIQISA